VKHLVPALDRLFTYARGERLTEAQRRTHSERKASRESRPPIYQSW
jgi:hypothetical protein